ncbi:hypothetical protein NSERUTF1_1439 [Nocardia seriolae]|nr:hypothetical protein NSERUTF1_1439 [Nocardia seriolae]
MCHHPSVPPTGENRQRRRAASITANHLSPNTRRRIFVDE